MSFLKKILKSIKKFQFDNIYEQKIDLENLSPELTRNFKLIHELDSRVHQLLMEIDKLKAEYLSSFSGIDHEKRLAKMKIIDQKYDKCKQFSDEKVQLANQTYEMVDKHIRRLDTDLAKFEAELKERTQIKSSDADQAAGDLNNHNLNASSSNLSTSMNAQSKKKKKVEQPPVIMYKYIYFFNFV